MGFSNNSADSHEGGTIPTGGSEHEAGAATHGGGSFGDRLGAYMMAKNPVVGGLVQAVFGGQQPNAANPNHPFIPAGSVDPSTASFSPGVMPQAQLADYSGMIGANAQPQQGSGGLATILKLIAG